jgi:hypothetical protein
MSMLNKLVNSSTRRGLDAPASASSPGGSPSQKDSKHEPALAPAAQTADPANDNEQVRTRERARLTLLVENSEAKNAKSPLDFGSVNQSHQHQDSQAREALTTERSGSYEVASCSVPFTDYNAHHHPSMVATGPWWSYHC